MNAAAKSVRKHSLKSAVPRSSVDILRIRVICNSLATLAGSEGETLTETECAALSQFLKAEILQLYRRIERAYAAKLASQTDDAKIKLDLLKEDHERLGRLAADAAQDVDLTVGRRGEMKNAAGSASVTDRLRRFLAAQRHQLIWYKLHIEQA